MLNCCKSFASLLLLRDTSEEMKNSEKKNSVPQYVCIAWIHVFDGCRRRSGRHLWATGGCQRKDWALHPSNLVPWHIFHAFDGSAEAYLCLHEISSKGERYRRRR